MVALLDSRRRADETNSRGGEQFLVFDFAVADARRNRLNGDAVIAGVAAPDYRPRMQARHGQGAAAAQARSPRSKLSDFFHLWVNNIRLFYSWGNLETLAPQLPGTMGNLQSDSKKKQKKKEAPPVPTSTSTVTDVEPPETTVETTVETTEDQKKDKQDQPPKVPERRDEPREPIKISFERVHTLGYVKRQAPPPPPIVVLFKVFGTAFFSLRNLQIIDRIRNFSKMRFCEIFNFHIQFNKLKIV